MSRYLRAWLSPIIASTMMIVLFGGIYFAHAAKDAALETRGVHVAATIYSLHPGVGRDSPRYEASYGFSPAPDVEVTGRAAVPGRIYATAKVGDHIEAVYDPARPSLSELWVSRPNDGGHPYRAALRRLEAWMAFFVVLVPATAWLGLRGERRREALGLKRRTR